MSSPWIALAALGGLWLSTQLHSLANFIYLHFIRSSSLPRYKDGSSSWALITGASDGIGKGFAEELCSRGFNVVLHGRNEKKLNVVKEGLLKQWPTVQIRILVIDAANEARDLSKIQTAAEQLGDLNLKVLVNNVGGAAGMEPSLAPFETRTPKEVQTFIDLNAQFPSQITRALLPSLLKNKPALIINVGSVAGVLPAPFLATYGGSKAFNHNWSRSLALEMKAAGHDVEVICLLVGQVSTAGEPVPTGLFVPDARGMARAGLQVVGSGNTVVWGYWPHAVLFEGILTLPNRILEPMAVFMAGREMEGERDRKKIQ